MNLFQKIRNWFTNPERNELIARQMNVRYRMPEDITELIALWRDIYMGLEVSDCDRPAGLAAIIAKDLSTKAVSELAITSDVIDAEAGIFDREMLLSIRQQVEYALAMGSVVCRPYVDQGGVIRYTWYSADRVLPTSWDGRRLTGCILLDYYATSEQGQDKVIYTKFEAHGIDRTDGLYHIRTKVYRNYSYDSSAGAYMGTPVPLSTVPEWAGITPDVVINNPTTETFCYMGTAVANNKSLNQPIGCSIFKDAIPWIQEFDEAFRSARWENKAGRSHIFVSDSMIPQKRYAGDYAKGAVYVDDLSALDRQIYKKLETETGKNLFEEWAPTLRFDSFTSYMNFLLHMVCILAGLDPGQYVFDEKSYGVTATEIISKQQKTYHTIVDIQRYMVTPLVHELMDSTRQLQYLYGLPALPEDPELSIDFGDSILIDEAKEKADALLEVQQGVRSKLSYLMDIRKLTEEEALEELERIKTDTPEVNYFSEGA